MRSYAAARGFLSFLGFLSWCVIVLGAILLFGGIAAVGQLGRNFGGPPMAGIAGMGPGVIVMFLGFLGLVLVQLGRAQVDTAELTQQMLKVARDQLEVSKQALKQGDTLQQGFAALSAQQHRPAARPDSYAAAKASEPETRPAKTPEHSMLLGPTAEEPVINGNSLTYRGRSATLINGKWVMNGITFGSWERLIQYVDEQSGQLPNTKVLRAER